MTTYISVIYMILSNILTNKHKNSIVNDEKHTGATIEF